MSLLSRLTLSAALVAGLAAPAMAQATSHPVKHRAPVTHHVTKPVPVAVTAPATATAVPAPAKSATP